MDPEEITKFFQQVMEQLGPTAQRTFQIVGQRVAAESTIWLAVGAFLIVASLIVTLIGIRWYKGPHERYSDPEFVIGAILLGTGIVCFTGIALVVSSAIILNSLEYSTIERILNLVGGGRR